MLSDNNDKKNNFSESEESDFDSFFHFETEEKIESSQLEKLEEKPKNKFKKNVFLCCLISFFFPIVGLILSVLFFAANKKETAKLVLISSGIGCGVFSILISIIFNPYKLNKITNIKISKLFIFLY